MCLNIRHIYFTAVQIVVLNVVGSSPTCHPSIAKRPRAFPGRFFRFGSYVSASCSDSLFLLYYDKML